MYTMNEARAYARTAFGVCINRTCCDRLTAAEWGGGNILNISDFQAKHDIKCYSIVLNTLICAQSYKNFFLYATP